MFSSKQPKTWKLSNSNDSMIIDETIILFKKIIMVHISIILVVVYF